MALQKPKMTVTTTHGPLDVVFHDRTHAVAMTPSNCGSYPELQFVVRGQGYQVFVPLVRDASGAYVPDPDTQRTFLATKMGNMFSKSYGDHAAPTIAAKVKEVVSAAVNQLVQAHPYLPAQAKVIAHDQAVERVGEKLTAARAEVARLEAELAHIE